MHADPLLLGRLEGRDGGFLRSRRASVSIPLQLLGSYAEQSEQIWIRTRWNRDLPGSGHPDTAATNVGQAQHVAEEEASNHVHVLRRIHYHNSELSSPLVVRTVCANNQPNL